MKKIGSFRKEGQVWHGTIAVLQFEAKARIVPAPADKRGDMPDFLLIKAGGSSGFEVEFGGGWNRYSQEQRVPYMAVTLDDPALARPINAILWEDRDADLWYLYWDRAAGGDHTAERLFVQEELKPQLGIRPLSRVTTHMMIFYPDLAFG